MSDESDIPEAEKIELTFKEVEVIKLNFNAGDTVAMVIKSDDIDGRTIQTIKENMIKNFPGVKILIFGIGLNDSINFTSFSENKEVSSCATGQFCVDCNCGKKSRFEAISEEEMAKTLTETDTNGENNES